MIWNNMRGLRTAITSSFLICAFLLSGCSTKTESVETASEAITEEVSEAISEEAIPVTEEEFRTAIQALTSSTEDMIRKVELYDRFANIFELTESEYVEYADACAAIGDSKKQREVLWKLYRLDPTIEHGELISNRVLLLDKEIDKDAYDILGQLSEKMTAIGTDDFDLTSTSAIFSNDLWVKSFFLDSGIFTSHSRCNDDSFLADIYADQVTQTVVLTKDGIAYGISTTAIGTDVWKCAVADNAYNGEFIFVNYDELGEPVSIVSGTMKDNHCIGNVAFVMGDTAYNGTFDDDGLAKAEQQENFDGLVYAYDDAFEKFLYVEGADASKWTADIEFLGMKQYEK